MAHSVNRNKVANSSVIADQSSWVAEQRKWYIRAFEKKGRQHTHSNDTHAIAGHIETDSGISSPYSHDSGYCGIYDLVKAYSETERGSHGSEIEIANMKMLIEELLDSRDGMDIAAVALFATLDPQVLSPRMQHDLELLIADRAAEWQQALPDHSRRLDDTYRKFRADALTYSRREYMREVSALDAPRFARLWIPCSAPPRQAQAFHWCIEDLDKLCSDAMSETFHVHGVHCRLRFRKSFVLSNGEDWVGVWLHNVSCGNSVLNMPFALVLSNIAYPTIYHTEVIKSSCGIRPSQGVGVKLFVRRDELTRTGKDGRLPLVENKMIRVSVLYY
ncbi:hypothetical protein GGI12_005372 [Dipsacomyces acuminosporus]|nr:hypothetical protein GGI12_005372 [Dipsacomyces acuminosporus]